MIIIYLLTIFGIAFALKEMDAPFNILNHIRIFLIRLHPLFFKLFNCYFCIGCWAGLITYSLYFSNFSFREMIAWFFAGGMVSLLGSKIIGIS